MMNFSELKIEMGLLRHAASASPFMGERRLQQENFAPVYP